MAKRKPEITARDSDLVVRIAVRASCHKVVKDIGLKMPEIAMALVRCHVSACPLKLNDLLKADDENFLHDVLGIFKNLDQVNGTLMNSFLPRYARL